MAEQVDAPDLISRDNCSNKLIAKIITNFDWIITNILANPVGRKARAGSTPAPSTLINVASATMILFFIVLFLVFSEDLCPRFD